MKYLIVIREKLGEKGYVVPKEFPSEEIAINKGMQFFRDGGLNRILVVDAGMCIVFKQERKCKCMNVQQDLFFGTDKVQYRCIECGVHSNHAEFKKWVMEKYGAEEKVKVEESSAVEQKAEMVQVR